VCKKLIKNSQPFGKNSENRRGDFLTHIVQWMCLRSIPDVVVSTEACGL